MTKNSIGQFIAALRKANGMTQQEVADRLHVSNKAVSRWERDECAPDLSVIPALAEMLGVTCDELLKGERIWQSAPAEKKEPRVEKQVKNLVMQTLSGFKTWIGISLAVAVIGLICMLGISYGFYRPVIGFAVMSLLEACALVMAILAVSRTKDVKTDHELFDMADSSLVSRYNTTLGTLSFAVFFVILAVILLSLPLIWIPSDYVNSVITPYSYFTDFFGGVVLILALVYLVCKKPYMAWITGTQPSPKAQEPVAGNVQTMTAVQLGLLFLAGLIFLFAPYLQKPREGFSLFDVAVIIALLCFPASMACFAVFFIKSKANRRAVVLPGLRNLLVMLPLPLLEKAHRVSWDCVGEEVLSGSAGTASIRYERYDAWNPEVIWWTVALSLAVFLVLTAIDALVKRKTQ